ncbi:nucleotide disphospho-sugar-binding domain-containing protein [Microbacterium hominis]|uniref:Glycosyltransferase family 1 protein n=1 Tax=Microbacterium hominis TaxID=162426 RepID=A0A7D4TE07_9MICO|nr:glycosyltransferase [Microbacterium hominis]QKJ18560.1 glycosyltransferase family 1 protein [Microbacterium hominis]
MTLLVISPDYASHLLPLATLATAWREAGERVVVATGTATAPIVADFGFDRVDLPLGRGANAGVMRTKEQDAAEAASLEGFFDATRRGMVPTLTYQARERLTDLMWQPLDRARATLAVVDAVRPGTILVDHLAFSARLALHTAGIDYADVVLGHPSALPVADEVYGFPPAWPRAFAPNDGELAELRLLCAEVSERFARQWNTAATALDPGVAEISDAFARHGDTVLYNYPALLAAGDGRSIPPHVFLGSTRRDEPLDAEVAEFLADDTPFVYVSFGSFLSVRDDVLARVAAAISRAGLRAAIATGSTAPAALGQIPDTWLVREFLPQVRLLGAASLAVTHGGNNSVTEAVGQGVPLLVLPFSTDQFAGAAAIERTGAGISLAPNTATVEELHEAVMTLADHFEAGRRLLAAEAAQQRSRPGPSLAYATLSSTPTPSAGPAGTLSPTS